jgi:hypothetical protein
MSTTTTFKRLALVTVAALGFGLLSVAPSNAAIASDTLTVTDGTASVGDTSTATSATATISFLTSDPGVDSVTVQVSLVSGPAANTLLPRIALVETTTASVDNVAKFAAAEPIGTELGAYEKFSVIGFASKVATAKFRIYIGASASSGVVTTGTYVVRVTPVAAPTAGTATYKDVNIVVSAATQSSTNSTAHISAGVADPDATTDLVSVVAANTAATAAASAAANIEVTQLKASGSAANESITAVITGPGTIGGGPTQAGAASAGRSLTIMTNGSGVAFINVFGDGTSGTATITLTGVTSGVVFGTKTVLFSSTTIATLTATVVNPVVASSGTSKSSSSTTGPISVVAKDKDGYQIYQPTLYVSSASTSVISDAYTSGACAWSSADLVSYCAVTPVAAGTANITVGNRASATATSPTTAVTSNAVAIRVGSTTAATMKLTTDKASYLPGEKITLTLAILDSTGLAVAGSADNTTYANVFAAGGITTDYAFYTGSDTLTAVAVQVKPTTSLKTWTLYAPIQSAELTMTAIPGTSFPVAYQTANALGLTAKISVGNSAGVDAATDAANEATDAANAATDAALAAADAADAATAAAEDASAAVATLAKSVNTALASLKKQITALTALVNKLLKK